MFTHHGDTCAARIFCCRNDWLQDVNFGTFHSHLTVYHELEDDQTGPPKGYFGCAEQIKADGSFLYTVDSFAYISSVLKVPVVYLSHHLKPTISFGTTGPASLRSSAGNVVEFFPVYEATVMKFTDSKNSLDVEAGIGKEHSKLAFFIWKGQQYMCVGGETVEGKSSSSSWHTCNSCRRNSKEALLFCRSLTQKCHFVSFDLVPADLNRDDCNSKGGQPTK